MCVCFCSHLFWRQSTPFGVCLTYQAGFEKKRKMFIFANCLKFENEAHVHLRYINLKMRLTLGTSFENDAHLGHINLRMMPTLGTSRPQSCFFLAHLGHIGPQRQVLYSASTSVNQCCRRWPYQYYGKPHICPSRTLSPTASTQKEVRAAVLLCVASVLRVS